MGKGEKEMSKVILEFDKEKFDDEEELKHALQGSNYYQALVAFSDVLRSKLKYEDLSEHDYKLLEKLREEFFEKLSEKEVSLW